MLQFPCYLGRLWFCFPDLCVRSNLKIMTYSQTGLLGLFSLGLPSPHWGAAPRTHVSHVSSRFLHIGTINFETRCYGDSAEMNFWGFCSFWPYQLSKPSCSLGDQITVLEKGKGRNVCYVLWISALVKALLVEKLMQVRYLEIHTWAPLHCGVSLELLCI